MKDYEKGQPLFNMFQDYWTMLKKLWDVEDSDAYFAKVKEMTDEFYAKYNTDYAKRLAIDLVLELDERSNNHE